MSLREQFASAAITGLLATGNEGQGTAALVTRAYEIADEMIRQQESGTSLHLLSCAVADAWLHPSTSMTRKLLSPGTYTVKTSDLLISEDGRVLGLKPEAVLTPVTSTKPKPIKRLKRDPLEGHPRADETRELMRRAYVEDEVEVMDLQASELACDIADLWVKARRSPDLSASDAGMRLAQALLRLELVTRPSAMRKVRP